MFSPYEHAARLRIPVVHADTWPDYGRWYPGLRIIEILPGLDTATERCTLAHELGHVVLGHPYSTPKNERQADLWAARKLLTIEEFERVAVGSPDAGQWCLDLTVTPHILTTFMSLPEYRQWHSQRNVRLAG